jgi:TetR/AcrR family transcriptional repressor of lmrAB and yxaGH operons
MTTRFTSDEGSRTKDELIALIGEVFREYGYAGASLSLIGQSACLGKGSLYHYFPEGKPEMARLVLAHVHAWFEQNVFKPLRQTPNDGTGHGEAGLRRMFDATREYFRCGRRICLVGAFALDHTRDAFARAIAAYFDEWLRALERYLERGGIPAARSRELSCATMAAIQGGLVLARALDDPALFLAAVADAEARLIAALAENC